MKQEQEVTLGNSTLCEARNECVWLASFLKANENISYPDFLSVEIRNTPHSEF